MKKFEFFDVTADIGFYAYGNNLNEAFENIKTEWLNQNKKLKEAIKK